MGSFSSNTVCKIKILSALVFTFQTDWFKDPVYNCSLHKSDLNLNKIFENFLSASNLPLKLFNNKEIFTLQ